jgi:phytoene dehydrogenase-like protein
MVGQRNTSSANDHVLMVGAGLCGALTSIMLADRGYKVRFL